MVASLTQPTPALKALPRNVSPPPIFVIGYMFSGTTLLRDIMGRHSEICAWPRETQLFTHLPRLRQQFSDLSDATTRRAFVRHILKSAGYVADDALVSHCVLSGAASQQHGSHTGFIRHVFDLVAQARGERLWCEKTPTHSLHLPRIMAAYPDAFCLAVVRDPRAVLAAKKTRRDNVRTSPRYTEAERTAKIHMMRYHPLLDAWGWRLSNTAIQRAHRQYPQRIHLLRYEDLTAEPERQVHAITEKLGIAFEKGMLDVERQNSAYRTHDQLKGRGIRPSKERWRQVLSPQDAALCAWVCQDLLEHWQYPPDTTRLSPAHIAKSIATLGLELGGRSRSRLILGGTKGLQRTVEDYWKEWGNRSQG